MFVVHKVFDTYEGHSGYDVPWSPMRVIPFANSNTHHNFHHSKNVGAFGGFTYIWDHVFGSNKEYYKMIYQI
jgi:4-alpha-methyl-delta7-sterol-4alpha-methyl oxidase